MNRRDFLKGTAAAGAAAVLPLSILPEREPKIADPDGFLTDPVNSRCLQRIQFHQDNGIYEVSFKRTRQGYGTGGFGNYTPSADFYTAEERKDIENLLETDEGERALCRRPKKRKDTWP